MKKRDLRPTAMHILETRAGNASFDAEASLARDSSPIPWITYPATIMLKRIVAPNHNVFEFGCGNSSLWWASRVASVISVEHDEDWASKVADSAPENLKAVVRKKIR